MKKKKDIPSLGTTGKEIYNAWRELRAFPGEVIEGLVVGQASYSMSAQGEIEISEHFRQPNGSYVSTVRKPTTLELDELHEAIDRGWIQIEGRKRYGCGGVRPFSDAGMRVRVYHQATGEPLAEWLETEAGKKWAARERRLDKELEAKYG